MGRDFSVFPQAVQDTIKIWKKMERNKTGKKVHTIPARETKPFTLIFILRGGRIVSASGLGGNVMPLLSCTARTCLYNKGELCTKGDIQIDGNTAKVADETCCRSFVERKEAAANSADTRNVSPTSKVDCKAHSCIYNKDEQCDAAKITVTGSQACRCEQTNCGSFCCR